MAQIYLFAIGGTGARVVRALSNILITQEIGDNEIIPVFIDNDKMNKDLTEAIRCTREYTNFKSTIQTSIDWLCKPKFEIINDIDLIENETASSLKFGAYIGYESSDSYVNKMDKIDKSFVESFFNTTSINDDNNKLELELFMDVGFKGRPKIGCIVYNELKNDTIFRQILQSCENNEESKIIIINSLFGGTGASGLPQLIKIINDLREIYPILQRIPIGAVSFFPYFNVELPPNINTNSLDINSSTWITKSKSEAKYYISENQRSTDRINVMYTLYDDQLASYKYKIGGKDQENGAHWLEIIGAYSILDFIKMNENDLKEKQGKIFLSKSNIGSFDNGFIYDNFQDQTKKNLLDPIIKTGIVYFLTKELLSDNNLQSYHKNLKRYKQITENIFNYLNNNFIPFIKDVQKNKRSLKLFNLDATDPIQFIMRKDETKQHEWKGIVSNLSNEYEDSYSGFLKQCIEYILK
ncbi:MAG: hypothetical protein R2771_06540 [Saprospiraceae bacterium]